MSTPYVRKRVHHKCRNGPRPAAQRGGQPTVWDLPTGPHSPYTSLLLSQWDPPSRNLGPLQFAYTIQENCGWQPILKGLWQYTIDLNFVCEWR